MELAMGARVEDGRAPSEDPALEEAADELLRAHGFLGRRHGIYTETQFRRKLRIESRREPVMDAVALPPAMRQFVLHRQLEDLVSVSRLSSVQETVFRLWATGLSIQDLAATLNVRHQVIAIRLSQARRKVRAACREGRYAGWYEVYLSEVKRSAYRPPATAGSG